MIHPMIVRASASPPAEESMVKARGSCIIIFINSFTGAGVIMRRARATFCGRRCNIATTYGCVPNPEATVRYGREKCQDTTLRPRVPPLSNVPDRRGL